MRIALLAAIYGAVSGVFTALTFALMNLLNMSLGHHATGWMGIFMLTMAGGLIIACLRGFSVDYSLDQQIQDAFDPLHIKKKSLLALAVIAITAVGFGGAIGPEAGLIAVTAELSSIVALLVARSTNEQHMIGEIGVAGTLSGLYASPPGAMFYTEVDHQMAPSATPKPLLFLAGTMGLIAFMLTYYLVMPKDGGSVRVLLPHYEAGADGYDLILSFIPAAAGAAVGLLFHKLTPVVKSGLEQISPSLFVQTLLGTLAFALLVASFPILRNSGHHELEKLFEHSTELGLGMLIVGALLKVLACAICLSSGWKGGAVFPLIFAGAAAGAAVTVVFGGLHISVALAAGMTAAATIGLGRPVAAVLITVMFVGASALPAVMIGALVGMLLFKHFDIAPQHH